VQQCDECIKQLEELCCAKHPRLAVGHRQSVMTKIADAKSQLERRFVHIGGEYVSSNDLLSGERLTPRLRVVY